MDTLEERMRYCPLILGLPGINQFGQCPNCLRKPIPYRRQGRLYCPKCNREYDMERGHQTENWAWEWNGHTFVPRHPTHAYVSVSASKQARRHYDHLVATAKT